MGCGCGFLLAPTTLFYFSVRISWIFLLTVDFLSISFQDPHAVYML